MKKFILPIVIIISIILTSYISWNLSAKKIENIQNSAYTNIDATVKLLQKGEYSTAYSNTSSVYKKTVDEEQFKQKVSVLKDSTVSSFTNYTGEADYLVIYNLVNDKGESLGALVIRGTEENGKNVITDTNLIK